MPPCLTGGHARANGTASCLHADQNDYILANVERFAKKARSAAPASSPLTGLRILDIDGWRSLAEPMARLGATVTGIDVTEAAIMAATAHARQAGLNIDYRCSTAEDLSALA